MTSAGDDLAVQHANGAELVLGATVGSDGPASLWQVVAAACAAHADRTALAAPAGRPLSYAALLEATEAPAEVLAALAAPLQRPLRVALHCRNRTAAVVLYYAALRAGCVPFLVDQGYEETTLQKVVVSCGLDAVLRVPDTEVDLESLEWSELVEKVAPSGGTDRQLLDSTALCRFTTGSTGEPQALEFTTRAVVSAAEAWRAGSALDADDRIVCMAGLANGLAFNTSMLPAVLAGATVRFVDSILSSNSLCRALDQLAATRLVAFPRAYELLAAGKLGEAAAKSLQSLAVTVSAGAPLSATVKELLAERLGLYVSDYYGLAECGPCTFEVGSPESTGSLGRCLPGVELRGEADEEGGRSLFVKSESMASRYLNNPGALAARTVAGFYASGDSASLRDGRLYLTGRSRRFVNQAGRKLDPAEVEACLLGLPGVTEACLVEVEVDGASLGALAVVAPGGEVGRSHVVSWLSDSLGAAKLPARIVFVDRLERSSIGKLMTVQMQEVVSRALSNERKDGR